LAEVVLAVDDAVLGGLAEPAGGGGGVLRAALAAEIVERQVVHGGRVAGLGGASGPAAGFGEARRHAALAVRIEPGERQLGGRVAGVGDGLQAAQRAGLMLAD